PHSYFLNRMNVMKKRNINQILPSDGLVRINMMERKGDDMLHKFARFVSSSKGSKAVIVIWIAAILILSFVAPGSSDVEESTDDGSAHQDRPSTEAQKVLDEHFPSDNGPVALLVYHSDDKISDAEREDIKEMSKWLNSDEKPDHV